MKRQSEIKDFVQDIGLPSDLQGKDKNEKEFFNFSCVKAIREKDQKQGGLGIWNNKSNEESAFAY